jgi:dynein heavy chain
MNILLREIISTLRQLDLGLKGQLTISDAMERLITSLANGKVPVAW